MHGIIVETANACRARTTAVLTGIGTVLDDDPRLTVRSVPVARQPWRAILDSRWRLPLDAALLAGSPGDVMVYGLRESGAGEAADQRRQALHALGVQVVALPAGQNPAAGMPLDLVLADLARRGVNELHVEAGARLTGALIQGGWADELLVYLAPRLLGPGRPLAEMAALAGLGDAPAFEWQDVARVGDDLRLLARRPGADLF